MIIHDISRDTLTTPVYEGDPETEVTAVRSMENGDEYNLSAVSMCVHAGTHIDAPLHFWEEGSPVDDMRLNTFYGKCTVISVEGILTGNDMERLLPYCKRRVLFHGNGKTFLSHSAAIVLAESKVVLVGTDADSIAPAYDEVKPHREPVSWCSKIWISTRWTTANMTSAPFPSSSAVWRQRPAARSSFKWKRG